jgi:methyl-accepting chemotaxis protein
MNTAAQHAVAGAPKYKRRMRNYLLDVGLQLRYTMTIVIVAVVLTAVLGYKMYEATRETSKVIEMTKLADPTVAGELSDQFASSDRWVIWGLIGVGIVLVISISAVGILITHRVAGPIFKVAGYFSRVRENRLGEIPQTLRKGDELQDFYSSFREMHQSLRERIEEDVRVLSQAVDQLEAAGAATSPPLQRALEDLRQLRRRKEDSLEPGVDKV